VQSVPKITAVSWGSRLSFRTQWRATWAPAANPSVLARRTTSCTGRSRCVIARRYFLSAICCRMATIPSRCPTERLFYSSVSVRIMNRHGTTHIHRVFMLFNMAAAAHVARSPPVPAHSKYLIRGPRRAAHSGCLPRIRSRKNTKPRFLRTTPSFSVRVLVLVPSVARRLSP
jgi:hypothetical protein